MTRRFHGSAGAAVRTLFITALVAGAVAAPARAAGLIQNVQVGDRTVTLTWNRAPSDTLTLDERLDIPGTAFGRYRVWRSETPTPEDFVLLRTYSLFDTTWGAFANSTNRAFNDPESIIPFGVNEDDFEGLAGPFNGFAYYYAVTWEDAYYDSASGSGRPAFVSRVDVSEGMWPDAVFPAAAARQENPLLGGIQVVPNPYNPGGYAGQQAFPGAPRIQFVNLPTRCSISIYTVDGGLVRILDKDSAGDATDWDLRNNDGKDVAAGIYVYYVRAAAQEARGRFVIIR